MSGAQFAMIVPMGGRSPVDPGYGGGMPNFPGVDNSLPAPPNTPPGVIWPPIHSGNRPDNSLPSQPGRPARPDNTLPGGGHVSGQPVPGGGRPDNTLPGQPVHPGNELPGTGKFWVVAGIPGYGWRYVCVDPSLSVGNELPSTPPPTAGTPIPPAPEPKR